MLRELKSRQFGPAILAVDCLMWILSLARPATVMVTRRLGNSERLVCSGIEVEFVAAFASEP